MKNETQIATNMVKLAARTFELSCLLIINNKVI